MCYNVTEMEATMPEHNELDILLRWERAAERARDERVRIIAVGEEYRATSTSHQLGSYLLTPGPEGWSCECVANREYGMPCKHLWALAEALDLDVLRDTRVLWSAEGDLAVA
jgi:hypothetical protein